MYFGPYFEKKCVFSLVSRFERAWRGFMKAMKAFNFLFPMCDQNNTPVALITVLPAAARGVLALSSNRVITIGNL